MTSLSMPAGLSLIFPKCDQHVGPIHHHMIACAGIFRERYTEVLFDKLEEFWNRPSKYIRSLTLTYIVE